MLVGWVSSYVGGVGEFVCWWGGRVPMLVGWLSSYVGGVGEFLCWWDR